ncbi:carbohydrate kinase family protein [Phytoactinopolyspora halotolerans]|uniref:Carbohydrate kinase family protein n=1 Tax=Phytoactinopolyspora halotolerans TaxID=1981512 RepID=A0A6L9SAU7_9ACTN|nr:carbohydrate kinase family protein [Phytoactinopolyspora halotolerans]NEE01744.1 carbohydrate kinase family protein [Phytoactinopolyspora halotolerans]
MRIAVTGSIATDQLMVFPGRFTDQLVADQLEQVSLSFLIDHLDIRRGGTAGNIAFGFAKVGLSPVLVGAVGQDFAEYRAILDSHGVDTSSIHVSDEKHTARFICTTDEMQNQIASFYTGAMEEAREIELSPIADRVGGFDLVLICPNDPVAMIKHTNECRERGYRFVADVGQQVARMTGDELRQLVDGAHYLFTNEYERSLLLEKTGLSEDEVLGQVDFWMTTLGAAGARLESSGGDVVTVPSVPAKQEVDPTGIGDAFRVGYFAGVSWQVSAERAMQVGGVLATTVLETLGGQDYEVEPDSFVRRFADAYGEDAAAEIKPFIGQAA